LARHLREHGEGGEDQQDGGEVAGKMIADRFDLAAIAAIPAVP